MITPKAINLNIDFENSTPQYCEFLRGDSIQFNFTFNDTYNATRLRVLCYTKLGQYAFGNEFDDLTTAIFYTNYTAGYSGQGVITVQLLDDDENLVNSANVVCKIIESNTQTPFIVSPDFANKTKVELQNLLQSGKEEIINEKEIAKKEIDEWSDQSSRLVKIESGIQTLGQVKSNRGELYFNKGTLMCRNNKWSTDSAFSYVFTFSMSQADWTNMAGMYYGHWVNTAAYGGGNNESGVWFGDVGNRLAVRIAYKKLDGTFSSKDIVTTTTRWSPYLDNNPHIICASFSNGIFKLNIDGNQIGSVSVPDFTPSENSQYFTIRSYGKISRVAVYNFDMSDENAPYTIADYISGKDESPLLNGGGDISLTTADLFTAKNNCTITESENGLTFTATSQYVGYASVKFPIIAGQEVEVSWEGEPSFTGNHNPIIVIGSTAQALSYTYGQKIYIFGDYTSPKTVIATNTGDYLGILLNSSTSSSSGDTATIKGLKIKVNGALLSLDDYSIKVGATQIVPDVSGNLNDATITGAVYGSKDNSIARLSALIGQANA